MISLHSADEEANALLDLFSTSQKLAEKCINSAPYICVPGDEKPGYLAQGCCNSWTCPRCGKMRARHEYGRMVEGARMLAKEGKKLWFLTITCTGDSGWQSAQDNYLPNTNRLLSTLRAHVKKNDGYWCYASVTERQKRLHPHSHFLSTFAPSDVFCPVYDYDRYLSSVGDINAKIPPSMRFTPEPKEKFGFLDYHSQYLMLSSVSAGLGVQARISLVDSPEACSRYIAKYLFKNTAFEDWPKGWKRVRYSQNWPKLPEKSNPRAFVILSAWDWNMAADSGDLVTRDYATYERAIRQGLRNVTYQTNPIQVEQLTNGLQSGYTGTSASIKKDNHHGVSRPNAPIQFDR